MNDVLHDVGSAYFLGYISKHPMVLQVTNVRFVVDYHTPREIQDVVRVLSYCSYNYGYYGIYRYIFDE